MLRALFASDWGTISGTGAHLDADFLEVLAAGVTTPAHVIHQLPLNVPQVTSPAR